ncbi:MAG: hypothetical protein CMD05_07030 [Flavobacteriales bacterium]|nr:hypothetical protein [Flavobacteriales bacterium]|tara:strand:+ start:25 stop:426 length:402 start_codon:yes stop_codon:yes gene_type:complete
MIQRLQSLFLFFSTVSLLVIVYYFPLLKDSSNNVEYYLKNSSSILRYLILASSILSVFAIFQFRNRNKQKIVVRISRLLITISLLLILFVETTEVKKVASGTLLLVIPFVFLVFANFFINKDQKLIDESERLR